MGETAIFEDGAAYVSRSRVVLHGVTYPVAAISSLRTHTRPVSAFWAVVSSIFGGCACLIGVPLLARGLVGNGLFFLAVGLSMIVFPIRAWSRARPVVTLVLSTQGHEVHALASDVPGYVERVVAAIHQAMAER